MLREILLPLAKSCCIIYNRPGDYHLLCFPSATSRSFQSVMNGVAFRLLSVSRPLFFFPFLPQRQPGSLLRGWLECDLWPWPLILAPLMTVVNWWEAKGRAFLRSVVICCVSPRPVEHVQSWGERAGKKIPKLSSFPEPHLSNCEDGIGHIGKIKLDFIWRAQVGKYSVSSKIFTF